MPPYNLEYIHFTLFNIKLQEFDKKLTKYYQNILFKAKKAYVFLYI